MTEQTLARENLKQRIQSVLRNEAFRDSDDVVTVSDGPDGDLYLRIVSRKFRGRRLTNKNDLVWSQLLRHLEPDQWGRISVTQALAPEEAGSA